MSLTWARVSGEMINLQNAWLLLSPARANFESCFPSPEDVQEFIDYRDLPAINVVNDVYIISIQNQSRTVTLNIFQTKIDLKIFKPISSRKET